MQNYSVVKIRQHFLAIYFLRTLLIKDHPGWENKPCLYLDHLVMQKNHHHYSTVLYSLCWVTDWCGACVQVAPHVVFFSHNKGVYLNDRIRPFVMQVIPIWHYNGSTKTTSGDHKTIQWSYIRREAESGLQ